MVPNITDSSLSINLEKISRISNTIPPFLTVFMFLCGYFVSFYFHFLTVTCIMATAINFYYRHVQTHHALLTNYGWIAQLRYMLESIGPELRQYLYSGDTEERPFSRVERSEVYRKAKGVDSSAAFGSQLEFNNTEYKLRHSLYPIKKEDIKNYQLTFGEERGIANAYTITKPIMISAMSYGSLGKNAVLSLARGAKNTNIPMNTGEGGYPKYHLMEGCDLIFQMGTAKFGVRDEDGNLCDDKLKNLSKKEQIKCIEIKLSQGAKPGKGGILPKEKITPEISRLRGVPMGKDVISPPYHAECSSSVNTVKFIRRVQEVSQLPVGIKMCLGKVLEFFELIKEMKRQNIFPDYLAIDGAEGGTGAAPKSFMDDIGTPLYRALSIISEITLTEKISDKFKIIAAGKLISPSKQFIAMALGAHACYTARGFMLALGCIQALSCNKNNCPVGITTHKPELQKGLDIKTRSKRIENYVNAMTIDHYQLLASLGKTSFDRLSASDILFPFNFYDKYGRTA